MTEKVTDRQRKSFESKIEGADKVEIKITVRKQDEERAYDALDVGHRDAVKRDIYFYDTPDLELYKAGVVLRARVIENDNNDTVVKIRPVEPDDVAKKWRETSGFKIEADAVGDKVVVSASYKVKQEKEKTIEKVADGTDKRKISDLFSKDQMKFLSDMYDGPLDLDALTVMGPVNTLRADIERAGMAYELTVEYWTLPDDSHLLEMSIKCPPEEAMVARKVFEGFLAGHGLDPHGAQATKTKLALTSLAKQL